MCKAFEIEYSQSHKVHLDCGWDAASTVLSAKRSEKVSSTRVSCLCTVRKEGGLVKKPCGMPVRTVRRMLS
jgi:hypothetical protein